MGRGSVTLRIGRGSSVIPSTTNGLIQKVNHEHHEETRCYFETLRKAFVHVVLTFPVDNEIAAAGFMFVCLPVCLPVYPLHTR